MMRIRSSRFFILIPLLFLALSVAARKAPVDFAFTRIDSVKLCPGDSKGLPVRVQNLIGIDAFQLVLKFDPTAINYKYDMGKHPDLVGGTFNVTETVPGTVTISWSGGSETTLFNDTLVYLVFEGVSGQSSMCWDTDTPGACFYHTSSGSNLDMTYICGQATVNPPMFLTLTEWDETCTGKCQATYIANVSGGLKPYTFRWNEKPGRYDSVQINLCDGPNEIRVVDKEGCEIDSIFEIIGLPGPKVEIKAKCKDEDMEEIVIYRENPILAFSFDEVSPTHVIDPPLWEFGDGDTSRSFNPVHTYYKAQDNLDNFYNLKLTLQNFNGCDTTIIKKIEIKDKKLKICNVILPTSASSDNQKFTIFDESGNLMKIEYLRFEVYIFDRWGRRLYANDNYQNDWAPLNLPNGVYYYVVKSVGYFNTDKFKGSFTILGGE